MKITVCGDVSIPASSDLFRKGRTAEPGDEELFCGRMHCEAHKDVIGYANTPGSKGESHNANKY